ncbi:hypothetical protein OHC33_009143 [Knufia fluminis]|uniref:HOOK N-terminal domain-containing protein n=1 Tax=Knufia fluminis TaxID=191047 RepID=A0AAN8E9G8_9EURO|nr:hypothetical protein OHC33_009143 [Knufia fluminis]
MATDDDVAAGLINWVNSLNVTEPFFTVDDLAAGDVLWKLLQLVDHISFPGNLPEDPSRFDHSSPQSWVQKWTNLKHVYDALSIFLIETCEHSLPIFEDEAGRRVNPDLKAIAQNSSLPDMIILLKLCVVAATSGPERIRFLEPMQDLPESVQRVLMTTLQDAAKAHGEHSEGGGRGTDDDQGEYTEDESYEEDREETVTKQRPLSMGAPTSDLAFEERLAKVIADSQRIAHEKRELQRHIDDINARHETLQERYDRSQDELTEANDRLSAVLSGRVGSTKESTDAQKEAVIASLEARVAEYETDIEGLRKSNEVLKIKAERTQKLQDDYDEIKIERDNLARKANTAEKYRQKLEATQDMERENGTLKQKITDLQAQVRQSDTRAVGEGSLAREVDEYRRLLPAIEQERHEVNEMKKRLEFDYHILQTRYNENEEQLRRARQEVEDLQGRLDEYDDGDERPSRRTTEGEGETLKDEDDTEEDSEAKDLEEPSEADFAAAEARLTEALVKQNTTTTTDGETMENDDGISEDELRAIMSAMRAQMHAGTTQERESGMKMQKKLVVMLEKARTKNVALVQHTKKQSELIQDLQSRPPVPAKDEKEPRESKSENEMEQQLEEQDVLIDNLKREIRLISSAWYEQNQRLATLGSGSGGGAVALMRLKGGQALEEPNSFLGRQRKMVERVMVGANVRTTRG